MHYRRKLVESQAAERNRLLKVLETANIKLANVATDDELSEAIQKTCIVRIELHLVATGSLCVAVAGVR
jgi:hypothetical protein